MSGYLAPGAFGPGGAPTEADSYPGEFAVTDLPDLPAEWLVELGSAPPPADVEPASFGQPGAQAPGSGPDAGPDAPTGTLLRFSLRGWIGEPGDPLQPNTPYLARLIEPPTLVRSIRVLPEDSPRLSFQSGEIRLDNADGGLNVVGGDWSMAGRPAVIRRGTHRTPWRAGYGEFGRVADLRIIGAALSSGDRLTLGLRASGADLEVPLCQIYAGTGGIEGDANLAGQNRPLLVGLKRNIAPVPLLAGALVWQVTGNTMTGVYGVRDRGAALTPGADYPSLGALLAASVAPGSYATCSVLGLVRTGSAPQGQLTVDARGGSDSTHGTAALAILRGPGGLLDERIVPGGFLGLPDGDAGWHWTGGTVAAALDEILASCGGWWGTDRLGRVVAGHLVDPSLTGPRVSFDRWMLPTEPSEVVGASPRWRQRVGYRRLASVQSATDLAGVVSADPAAVAAWGTEQQITTAWLTAILQAFPGAIDPEPLSSGFDQAVHAQALADSLLALHGARRRRWRVPVGKWGHLVDLGDTVAVDHPRLAGRNWIVIASDEVGDDITLTLWG